MYVRVGERTVGGAMSCLRSDGFVVLVQSLADAAGCDNSHARCYTIESKGRDSTVYDRDIQINL